MARTTKVENNDQFEHFTYCSTRECIHTECLRHNVNTPWNVLIYRKKYKLDKDGNCKDMVRE